MRRVVRRALMLLASLVLLPAAAYAQAAITGVVRDTSGAVLPGVTVEAASPALIERVRSGVTDGTGRYRIEQLRPGSYAITFTLPGFATVRQEDVQLMGTFVATVNAELRVGALEETVTVTGDTSVVDVQSAVTQRVMTDEIINALPSGKVPGRLASLLPSVNQAVQDVGGLQGDGSGRGDLTTHGVGDARQVVNGLSNMSMSGSRGAHGAYNMAAFAEMAVDTAGIGAEQKEGGVRLNLIPQDGGNSLKTYFFFSFANSSMQGDNFTQELKDRGLGTPDSLKRYLDVNPAVGGPILRDKLWFHTTARLNHAFSYLPLFFNKNAGNPNAWTYEPDASRPASNEYSIANTNTRVTWQVTPKHKIGVTYDLSRNCDCPRGLTASRSPEANSGGYVTVWPKHQPSADWTAPLTSRLLLEAGAYSMTSYYHRPLVNPYFAPTPVRMIQVMEQSTGMAYRATAPFTEPTDQNRSARAVMSYITGAHAFKFGVQYATGYQPRHSFTPDANISYRFNNGVPNRLTLFAPDWYDQIDMKADHGVFVQDRWTVNRLTMTGGLRLDHFHIGFPEITVGPTLYAPTRNIVFPASDGANWSNISPRFGAAYDLFGDGKTALKMSIGRYLAGQIGSTSMVLLLSAVQPRWRATDGGAGR